MRLLDAEALIYDNEARLEEFIDERSLPQFAILSHTWEKHEVLFHDIALGPQHEIEISLAAARRNDDRRYDQRDWDGETWSMGSVSSYSDTCSVDGSGLEGSSDEVDERSDTSSGQAEPADVFEDLLDAFKTRPRESTTTHVKAGWNKVPNTCLQASRDGHRYVWIDTCCIDKSSSAELSEAINSMYRWYSLAAVCYVYLSDCTKCPQLDISMSAKNRKGIHVDALRGNFPGRSPSGFSIAQRMSWAAKRETTRIEDAAYSLLGLFNINIPFLYGEGRRAFPRLQEEIVRTSADQSIFAWDVGEDSSSDPRPYTSLFANSIVRFGRDARNIDYLDHKYEHPQEVWGTFMQLTGEGVRLDLPRDQWRQDNEFTISFAYLNCTYKGSRVGLRLRNTSLPRPCRSPQTSSPLQTNVEVEFVFSIHSSQTACFSRLVLVHDIATDLTREYGQLQELLITYSGRGEQSFVCQRSIGVVVQSAILPQPSWKPWKVVAAYPVSQWKPGLDKMLLTDKSGVYGAVAIDAPNHETFLMVIGRQKVIAACPLSELCPTGYSPLQEYTPKPPYGRQREGLFLKHSLAEPANELSSLPQRTTLSVQTVD
ncbi:uncharacterized protein LTR77_007808 [Saxophila tyrrhenica]|uniref:Heterokaryon incompatibility domain-containing protein n=1 Tax=Saxophila tyrrhenica TaxID=1690608 RepID=A0AAV9P719_9PEZI|nr:hypothetical protein LTR77_007808 [Saxophila tyrrhenica]